jgi:hypothetical protein
MAINKTINCKKLVLDRYKKMDRAIVPIKK